MATTKKTATKRKSSSGSDPKSKSVVKKKMANVMHEFKHGELKSGGGSRKVKNPRQAIAIGLSEARRSGAKIPPSPNAKKSASKRSGGTAKKSATKRAPARKTASKTSNRPAVKKTAARNAPARKAAKKSSGRR